MTAVIHVTSTSITPVHRDIVGAQFSDGDLYERGCVIFFFFFFLIWLRIISGELEHDFVLREKKLR